MLTFIHHVQVWLASYFILLVGGTLEAIERFRLMLLPAAIQTGVLTLN
jgi:hypothetical protein